MSKEAKDTCGAQMTTQGHQWTLLPVGRFLRRFAGPLVRSCRSIIPHSWSVIELWSRPYSLNDWEDPTTFEPGSGKTTLARSLEGHLGALRLSVDEWHVRLFGMDVEDKSDDAEFAMHNARHGTIESLLWETASRVVTLGVDVILDFGFWTRRERDELRARASALGAGCRIHFADAPKELLLARIRTRNRQLPLGTFFIPEARLEDWMNVFEAPSEDELAA